MLIYHLDIVYIVYKERQRHMKDQKKQKRFEGSTTIRIKDEVHDRLAQVGHWGESMSDIINRLVDEHYELERLKKRS
jgi:hypothetical protein